ncbi:lymphocyte antigen 75 isoform X2 [Alosa sapidissima]|uniref:lymphocyte antigen 75 isoform X2 n=1 Tax=Alosa sapidissima TaxID=34773 RepID=UPI001C09F3E5|nr:lymphocyte antigen 75 isoform X2 [Alosa sapidissima]
MLGRVPDRSLIPGWAQQSTSDVACCTISVHTNFSSCYVFTIMEPLRRCHLSFLCRVVLFVVLWQVTRTDCPADGRTWVPFGNSCYHFVHGEEDKAKSYTIEEAKRFCQNGTGLLQISSAEENEFVIKYSPNVWKDNLNVWLGMSYDSNVKKYQWFDHTALSYKNWEEGSDLSPVDTCVALHLSTGQWLKVSCADDPEHGVVCQAPGEMLDDCPKDGKNWTSSGTRCYHFVQAEAGAKAFTFEAAKAQCQGYELLQPITLEENQYIVDYSPNVWKSNINIWLGMYYDTDVDGFSWFNYGRVSYDHFEDTEDTVDAETCAAMRVSTGQWLKVSCNEDVEHGVVCEADDRSGTTRAGPVSPLMSALVILSVLCIIGVSAVLWFVNQRKNPGSSIISAFEYHPPFRSPGIDETCLVEAEENDDQP